MIHAWILVCLFMQAQTAQPTVPPEVLTLLNSGVDAENRRDLDQAIAEFRQAANLAPSAGVVFFRLGDAYMKKRDYASAIPPLKRAAELSPDSAPVHQLLGYALLTEGYVSEAIPHLTITHEYGALGIAQLQVGQPAEAVRNLQTAAAKSPDDPDLLYYLSRAGAEMSSQSLDKLLQSFPDSARAHQAKGRTLYQAKMYPEAIAEYKKALQSRPDLPGLRLELGEIYGSNSDWEKAEQQFREEAELQPGSAEAAYRLGSALLEEGKMEGAAEELLAAGRIKYAAAHNVSGGSAQSESRVEDRAERRLGHGYQLRNPGTGRGSTAAGHGTGTHFPYHRREGQQHRDEATRLLGMGVRLPGDVLADECAAARSWISVS